ncbi:MAG TPA: S8 family serine peptidase [Candidatus Thermoplasmatota archaeon]
MNGIGRKFTTLCVTAVAAALLAAALPELANGDSGALVSQGPDEARPTPCDHPGAGHGRPSCPGVRDPYRDLQWNLDVILAESAWKHATGKGVVVAVIDTGVDQDHPDLVGKLLILEGAAIAGPSDEGPEDHNAHGTMMAGIVAAATNNGIGISGGAPGATVMPIRYAMFDVRQPDLGLVETYQNVLDPSKLTEAIRFATENGADVISISQGFPVYPDDYPAWVEMRAAIDEAWAAGIVIVAAAGNSGAGAEVGEIEGCLTPADHPLVLCVGATTREDGIASDSSFDGKHPRYLVAPGGDGTACEGRVLTTWPVGFQDFFSPFLGDDAGYMCRIDDAYNAGSGTSQAAPLVAAVAAMLLEQGLTNEQVVDRILHTADDLGEPGRDAIFGWGRLNALRAVTDDRNDDGADGASPVPNGW